MDLSSYIILFLVVLLGASIFYVVKFALIILRVQDAIEEGLEIIDERYGSITEVLKIPSTREALLYIARTLSRVEETNLEPMVPEEDSG